MSLFRKKDRGLAQLPALALNYIVDGVIILGVDGKIRLINPAGQRLIGQTAEEVVGVGFASVVRLIDAQGKEVAVGENPVALAMLARAERQTRDYSVMPRGGDKPVPVQLTVQLGNEVAILTLRNITSELAEEAERNDFISTASHEMRTPVASIEGYLGLAINPETATIDERAREYLVQAHEASKRLGKLFKDLLDTTRLDDGRMVVKPAPTEMVGAVKTVADSLRPIAEAKGLKYVFDSGAIAGAKVVTPTIYAMVDMDFLWEILDNLIDNAVKYTPRGEVRVSVRGDDTSVTIGVADSGIGIGGADLPHIFAKFYRADNSDTRTVGGTGLGLHIVKQRVEAMGGRVWVESRMGEGSKFYFSLPRLTAAEYEKRKLVLENEGKMVTKKPEGV